MRCDSHVVVIEYRNYSVCECRRQAFRVSDRTRGIWLWKKLVKWTFKYEKELVIRKKQQEGCSRGGWLFCEWTEVRNAELFQRLKDKGEDWEELMWEGGYSKNDENVQALQDWVFRTHCKQNGNYTQTFSTNSLINIWLPQETQVLKNDVR